MNLAAGEILKFACLRLLVFGAALTVALPAISGEPLDTAMKSVVSVLPDWPPNIRRSEEPEGSGVVLIDGRTIVTSAHVINRATRIRVRRQDRSIVEAKLVASDRFTDIAVLSVEDALPVLPTAEGDPALGQEVCAIGNAFGLGLSLTCGVVSAVHRAGVGFNRIEDFVQTDAAVNPGASGGALVSRDGRLVGMLSAIFTKKSDANIGVNFAIGAPLVERVARALKTSGKVVWAKAGLLLIRTPRKGETGRAGALVRTVRKDMPAEASGIRPGDLIVRAGGRPVAKPSDFTSALAMIVPPGTMELIVIRSGTEQKITLTF